MAAFVVALMRVTPGCGLITQARADDAPCGKCPSCPSAKTIAEQVTEDLAAKPQPTLLHCQKHGKPAVGGYITHCAVFLPAAGAPPLVAE